MTQRTINEADIIAHMKAEAGVYILGCFERRVTLYSQQVRALNLALALHHQRLLTPGSDVAIIGGGAAGMTAAAALATLGSNVALLERQEQLLHLFRGNHTRWIHPHLYDWPQSTASDDRAKLPLLDWSANTADAVAHQLMHAWNNLPSRTRITTHLNVRNIARDHLNLTWHAGRMHNKHFAAIILAVGFGTESGERSYWANDNLHQSHHNSRKCLVSGCGDGGLTDLLRLRLLNFHHQHILALANLVPDPVRQQLLDIEEDARLSDDPSHTLYQRYQTLQLPELDNALQTSIREQTTVILNGTGQTPFSLNASILNRLLMSRLLWTGLEYRPGKPTIDRVSNGYEVTFANCKPIFFDEVVQRHGPSPALKEFDRDLWGSRSSVQDRNALDQTRWPLFTDTSPFVVQVQSDDAPSHIISAEISAPSQLASSGAPEPQLPTPLTHIGATHRVTSAPSKTHATHPPPTTHRINPYRSLHAYEQEDGDFFPGRSHLIRRTIDELVKSFHESRPAIINLSGDSGVGKSSLLRAGILHELTSQYHTPSPSSSYRYDTITLRPLDCLDRNGLPSHALRKVLARIFRATQLPASTSMLLDPDVDDMSIVDIAASSITQVLAAERRRLIIGFDQFEEVLDDLEDKRRAPLWAPLLAFLDSGLKGKHLGLIVTIETGRSSILGHYIHQFHSLQSGVTIHVTDNDPVFLRSIIQDPFRNAGFNLDSVVIDELHNEILELLPADTTPSGAILPLVSVKLTRLFEHVDHTFANHPIADTSDNRKLESKFDNIVRRKDLPSDLSFKKEIENLVRSAWRESGIEENEREISRFLRSRIRLVSPGSQRLRLTTVGTPPFPEQQALERSFTRHRLLIPVGRGKRLVHEAVIRAWPEAAKWLHGAMNELEDELRLRQEAIEWSNGGNNISLVKSHISNVDAAAAVLDKHSVSSTQHVDDEHKMLMDYCISVFSTSREPLRLVPKNERECAHVHLAAFLGLVDILDRFSEISPLCLELEDNTGRRPLFYASWYSPVAVAFLLARNVDTVVRDNAGWHPIAATIVANKFESFMFLFPHYSKKEFASPAVTTLLHTCAIYNRVEFARRLIQERLLDVNARDANRMTPLHLAAAFGNLDIFVYLSQVCDVGLVANGKSILHMAAEGGNVAILRYILQGSILERVDLTACQGPRPLALAVLHQRSDAVALLLSCSDMSGTARPDGDTLLNLAIDSLGKKGDASEASRETVLRIVKHLLGTIGVNPNERSLRDNRSPFERAENYNDIRLELLQHPHFEVSCPLAGGKTALMVAVDAGSRKLVQSILARPEADVRSVHHGSSVAELMIRRDMGDLVRQMVASGRLDPWTNESRKLLRSAVAAGDMELTSMIIDRCTGVTMERRRAVLGEALPLASMRNDIKLVQTLLQNGADPDMVINSELGITSLMIAAEHGRKDILEHLIRARSDVTVGADSWGRSVFDYIPNALREWLERSIPGAQSRPSSSRAANRYKPFYDERFTSVRRRASVLNLIASSDPGSRFSADASVEESKLPFYKRARLLRVRDRSWTNANTAHYYLLLKKHQGKSSNGIFRLDGKSEPIHKVNEIEQLNISESTILSYIVFFCFFTRSDGGPFLVVDRLDNPYLPFNQDRPATDDVDIVKKMIAETYRPLELRGSEGSEGWRADAVIYYDHDIFGADFIVSRDGSMRMTDDRLLRTGLPLSIEASIT